MDGILIIGLYLYDDYFTRRYLTSYDTVGQVNRR